MCAASPDPPRCSPYTRSRRSRPPAAPADTAAHRGSGGPTAAAITHRHVCLQPRGAVATAERCTLGTVVLFDPRRHWLPPCWETGKTTTPSRPSRRAARRLVLAGRASYISQEATGAPLLRRSNCNCCFVRVLGFFRVCLFACLFVFSLNLAPFHGCSAATPMAPER